MALLLTLIRFFCCALLACHEGRRGSPSVSETGDLFVAHAVRARGSDGHQNVCGRSTILKL